MEVELNIVIRNQFDHPLEVMLEPWGEIYPIVPHSFMRFVMESGAGDAKLPEGLEIETSRDGLTIYPPPGSLVRLLTPEGAPLGEDEGPRTRTP
jgi:hypothetical protein